MMKTMKHFDRAMVSCLLLVTVACGGSGSGPAADDDKTPSQVQTDVKGQDTAALKAAVVSYETALGQLKTQAKKLGNEIKEASNKMASEVLGEAKADELKANVKAQAAELEVQLKQLRAKLEDTTAKLKAYTTELANRN